MLKRISIDGSWDFVKICLLLGCILWSNVLFSQNIWTTDQFLSFNRESKNLPFQQNIDFLDQSAKGLPLIDNYEFRTETDEMKFAQQRYQFRLQFNSADERKAYHQILLSNKDKYNWLQAKYVLDQVENRYKNIVDLYYNQKERALIKEELILLEDKKIVLRKILERNTTNVISDWISNENKILEVRSDSLESEMRRNEIAKKLFLTDQNVPELDETDWIEIENLKALVDAILGIEDQHPEDALLEIEENLANAEHQLEVAEGNKWFEFAQIQYQADNDLNFQRELSFGTSIVIPHKNNNRARKNETALELMEKSYESIVEQEERKNELIQEQARFKDQIQLYEDYKILKKEQQLDTLYATYETQKLVSPLVLIDLRMLMINQEEKQMDMEKDIFETYINILSLKAAFLTNPNKNYLKN